jgi:carbon-monoxide dehydrogenase small subunit
LFGTRVPELHRGWLSPITGDRDQPVTRHEGAGMSQHRIEVIVNGRRHGATVEARSSLGEFLRENLGYTGTHLACEHGVCGACTVMVQGAAVRSCLMLAVQADGEEVTTVEGLAASDGTLHTVQQALRDNYGLQCGFCTPGVAITLAALTADGAKPSVSDLEAAMSGHICRCTGYQGIRRAIRQIAGEVA